MNRLKLIAASGLLILSATPVITMACGPAEKMVHMGAVLTVDASGKTFTIRDSQTQAPITFLANNEILEGLKEAKGSIMVNYEEDGDKLKAVGVTF